jgi:hypothetical protein
LSSLLSPSWGLASGLLPALKRHASMVLV